MKLIRLTIILIIAPLICFGNVWGPDDLTVSNLQAVTNNTTITLTSGTYSLTPELLDAWTNGQKENVTFQGEGKVILDASSFGDIRINEMNFNGWTGLLLKNLEFRNIGLVIENCKQSELDGIFLSGMLYTSANLPSNRDPSQPKKASSWALRVLDGENNTIKNCQIVWPKTSEPGKGLKIDRNYDFIIENNSITGNLVMGMNVSATKQATNNNDPILRGLIEGGEVVRDMNPAYSDNEKWEDHGLYILNGGGTIIRGVTFSGWTDQASGHGIKMKGVQEVEVANCTFKDNGGIIIREASNWVNINDHIWIHDNVFEDFGVNGFGLSSSQAVYNSCVIENNVFLGTGEGSGVTFNLANPVDFNRSNKIAKKNGGIFNNCGSLTIPKNGINFKGNGENGCIENKPFISVTELNISQTEITLDIGETIDLSVTVSPSDASNPTILWQSDESLIASINSSGRVTAFASGTTRISAIAYDGGIRENCTISVNSDEGELLSVGQESKSTINIYPNPVKTGVLNLVVYNIKSFYSATLLFRDLSGKVVQSKEIVLKKGENSYSINLDFTSTGYHLLSLVDLNGMISISKPFIIQ